jgi:hypothetical protein
MIEDELKLLIDKIDIDSLLRDNDYDNEEEEMEDE